MVPQPGPSDFFRLTRFGGNAALGRGPETGGRDDAPRGGGADEAGTLKDRPHVGQSSA